MKLTILSIPLAIAVGPAATHGAQGGDPLSFHPRQQSWDSFLLPPGEGTFWKAVPGDFTGNGMLDAAVQQGSRILVLPDPGRRKLGLSLDDAEAFHDLVLLPAGDGERDALLAAGTQGVSIWGWDEDSPDPTTRRATLTGSWSHADRILVHAFPGTEWVALEVWESTPRRVHPLLLQRTSGGEFLPMPFPSWGLSTAPLAMDLGNFSGDAAPELAVADASGLRIRNFSGAPVASFPGTGTVAVVSCGRTASGLARFAWLRRVAQSPPSYELVVVQDGSVEAPIELEGEEIVSVVAGESAAGVHLALGLSDGNVRILSECVLPTTTFSPACSTLVALAPHIQSFASPLLADFDLSRCSDAPDLLSFDDATRSAWITRGAGPSENMIALTSVADDFPHVELGLEVSEHDASTIRVTTYEWPVIPESGWRRIGEPFDVEANPITHVAFDLPPSSASQAFVFEIVLVADGHGPDRGLEALYCMLVDGDGCYAMGAPPSSLCIPPQACPTGNGSRGVIQIPGGLRCQIPNCGN